MIFDKTILKKLLNKTFKEEGLTVAHTDFGIYLAGSYWEIEMKKEFIPNEILGEIVKLAGGIPEQKNTIFAQKDGIENEEYDPDTGIKSNKYHELFQRTDVILIGNSGILQRVLQNPETGELAIVNNIFCAIESPKMAMEECGEITAIAHTYSKKGIMIANNTCKMTAKWRDEEFNRRTLDQIRGLDLLKDREMRGR